MRILHTSDWHLSNRLYHVDRQPALRDRLDEIARHLEEHHVDVMVVSGDLFSQRHYRIDDIARAMCDVREVFKPFLLRGGTMVAISGNHDDEALFSLLRHVQDVTGPIDPTDTGPRPRGRLYLCAQPTLLRLADLSGQIVQFLLLPYPTVHRYLKGEDVRYRSLEERNSRLHKALLGSLENLRRHADERLQSVLVAHAYVRGSQIHTLYEIEEKDDVMFEPGDLPGNFAYVAYGHIHKAQKIAGADRIRYSGSIERLNLHERSDEKSVVLVEIGRDAVSVPECLPLHATPIHQVTIQDPEPELRALRDYPDRHRALLYYKIIEAPGRNADAVRREIEDLFPNWCKGEVVPPIQFGTEATSDRAAELSAELRDLPGTVSAYLRSHLKDDQMRERAIALVNRLIMEEDA